MTAQLEFLFSEIALYEAMINGTNTRIVGYILELAPYGAELDPMSENVEYYIISTRQTMPERNAPLGQWKIDPLTLKKYDRNKTAIESYWAKTRHARLNKPCFQCEPFEHQIKRRHHD